MESCTKDRDIKFGEIRLRRSIVIVGGFKFEGVQLAQIFSAPFTFCVCVQTLAVTDYTKNLDAVVGIFCQMMSGKSFELILSAAAVTGKLPMFAAEFIK